MKNILKILLAVFFILAISTGRVNASEGTIKLESITAESYRCYAASIQMMDRDYEILVTCRNLIYPAGDNIFQYIMWTNPLGENKKPEKLGELGLGRARFSTGTAFSSLFVTTEVNRKSKEPEGPTVMRGNLERITFLDQPSPAQVIDIEEEEEEEIKITPTTSQIQAPTEADTESESAIATTENTSRLIRGLRRTGIVIGIALIVIVGIVFVLTRMRR